MAIPGSFGSYLGIKKETTWGTAVAVDRFYLINSEAMKARFTANQRRSINSIIQRSDERKNVMRGTEGPFEVVVSVKGMGVLLQQVFGSSVSAQVGATAEYTQTHVLDEAAAGKGMHATIQVGRSDNTGTVRPFTYDGSKIVQATLSCDEEGYLTLAVTTTGRKETHTGSGAFALQSATYVTDNPAFSWDQATFTLNSVARITKRWSLDMNKTTDANRGGIGSPLTREPLLSGEWALTGEIDCEFENITDYEAFANATDVPLNIEFDSGIEIASTGNNYKFIVDIPAIQYTGDTPVMGGEGLIRQPLPYMVVDNATDVPITVVQHTSDTAL